MKKFIVGFIVVVISIICCIVIVAVPIRGVRIAFAVVFIICCIIFAILSGGGHALLRD